MKSEGGRQASALNSDVVWIYMETKKNFVIATERERERERVSSLPANLTPPYVFLPFNIDFHIHLTSYPNELD